MGSDTARSRIVKAGGEALTFTNWLAEDLPERTPSFFAERRTPVRLLSTLVLPVSLALTPSLTFALRDVSSSVPEEDAPAEASRFKFEVLFVMKINLIQIK